MDKGNCELRTAQSAQDDWILTEDRGIGRNYSRYTLGRCPVKMINAPLSGPSLSAEEMQHWHGSCDQTTSTSRYKTVRTT